MGAAYAQDLRDRVLSAEGQSASVAARFRVSISYVIKARQRRDRDGDLCARPQRSQTPAKLAGHDEVLKARVADVPDATLAAFARHGALNKPLADDGIEAVAMLDLFRAAGIDIDALAAQLQRDGAQAFVKSWESLMSGIAAKRSGLGAERGARIAT